MYNGTVRASCGGLGPWQASDTGPGVPLQKPPLPGLLGFLKARDLGPRMRSSLAQCSLGRFFFRAAFRPKPFRSHVRSPGARKCCIVTRGSGGVCVIGGVI